MKNTDVSRIKMQVLMVVVLVFFPIFGVPEAKEMLQRYQSRNWPVVDAVVDELITQSHWDRKSEYHTMEVSYRYQIDGDEYISNLVELGTGAKRFYGDAAIETAHEYRKGSTHPIHYDPSDPAVSILETDIGTPHIVLMGVGAVFWMVAVFFVVRMVKGWTDDFLEKFASPDTKNC